MKQSVFISGQIPAKAAEILRLHFELTINEDPRLLNKAELIKGLDGKDALLCLLSDNIDADIIRSDAKLKVIANYGAGFNNIDVKTATELKIPVTNTPAVSTEATADLTMGLLIAIARRIVEGDKNTRSGKFHGWAPLYHLGVEVTGKTLGIIGLGNIGKAVAKRAHGFDMKVVYYNRTRLTPEQEAALDVEYLPLDQVIRSADFLSLHLSYSPALRHMIGAEQLQAMKPTAYLINAARGPLVDEAALLAALETKTIAGAALDVYEFEPKVTAGLEQLDNAILCPHLGNATIETRDAMAQIAADNIVRVLQGKRAATPVNPEIYR